MQTAASSLWRYNESDYAMTSQNTQHEKMQIVKCALRMQEEL